jgi:hypothetical protein
MVRLAMMIAFVPILAAQGSVRLSEQTRKAFDEYARQVESQVEKPAAESLPALKARAMKGEIVAIPFVNRKQGEASLKITDGLINHWLGVMYVPGATVDQIKKVMQNYAEYSKVYAPEVTESKLVKQSGEEFDVFLRLHRQVRIKALLGYGFPVEFNTAYHVRYYKTGETQQVRSISTRIAQVKDPKKSHTEEHEVGYDSGYLWRLQSYWRLYPVQGGVMVECEAVSLSRSVPGFVEKMVTYFTTNFPEDSMRNTLKATRDAATGRRT